MSENVEVIVIGSGFAGIGMAISLRRQKIPFLILERSSDVGGVWRDNRYPGCACDIPSLLYSFSFEPKTDWTRLYPTQPEIWDYLKKCIDKYGLQPYLRFNTGISEASFDEATRLWTVQTATGERLTSRILISAMGAFSRPALPTIPGLERFRGPAFHSAAWDHSVDLRGKRVGVLGTGASAIQFVPQIAGEVSQLFLFQRTPPWIIPKEDRSFGRWEQRLLRGLPGYLRVRRNLIYWQHESRAAAFTWSRKFMNLAGSRARRHLAANVPDAALRAKLTPNYLFGCKRILLSNDYYPALQRSNVEVVTDSITEIRDNSVVTEDGRERTVDALIYGTGFQHQDQISPVRIFGRNRIELNDAWRDGAQAYMGTTIVGFPNFFMMTGPNTGLGHNSVVFMIEAQMNYISKCLAVMRATQAAEMEVRAESQSQFNRLIQRRMLNAVWTSGCKSYYLNAHGTSSVVWPGFTFDYWLRTRHVKPGDYRLTSDLHPPVTYI